MDHSFENSWHSNSIQWDTASVFGSTYYSATDNLALCRPWLNTHDVSWELVEPPSPKLIMELGDSLDLYDLLNNLEETGIFILVISNTLTFFFQVLYVSFVLCDILWFLLYL